MRKLTATILALVMMINALVLNLTVVSAAQPELTACVGGNESIYAIWSNDSDAANATVSYKSSDSNQYTQVDGELVRAYDTGGRVDIVGLSAGSYDIKIVTTSGTTFTRNKISVSAYDRSGYAHFNYTKGVGAYNDDGTPKANADIIYVTNENKNSVTYGGKTGIGNILANAKNFSNPVIIRIIGTVDTCLWDKDKTQTTDLANGRTPINGLTSKFQTADTYLNMADVQYSQNITVEGIGDDAIIDRWGFTFSHCSSIEVRNLTFQNYPEDACSFQGHSNDDMDAERFWLHNCTFNIGLNWCDLTDEQDKGDGDGSTDIKFCNYVTYSYNRFNKCHKTSLHGGGNAHKQYNVTWHHNYFNQCSSRLPLIRQTNMHSYNNYYYGTKNQCIDARASAWVLSENNYFENANNPYKYNSDSENGNPVIKVYGDVRVSSSYSSSDHIVLADSRDTTYSFSDNNNPYPNFDTDSSVFYYDAANKCSKVEHITSAEEAKTECIETSGVLKTSYVIQGEEDDGSNNDGGDAEITSKEYILLPKDITAAEYTSDVSSGIFTVKAADDKKVTVSESVIALGGSGSQNSRCVTFTTNSKGSVTITAVSSSTSESRTLTVVNSKGTEVGSFTVSTENSKQITLPTADTYYIYSTNKGINIKKLVVNVTVTGILGDVNGNKALDKADATAILRYCALNVWDSQYNFDLADANGDGSVDILDSIYILGLLPTESTTESTTETTTTTTTTTTTESTTEATTYVLDLTNGLSAGTDYNGVSVLEDMSYKEASTSIDGTTYAGYVVGTNNPTLANNLPTGGSVLKITPKQDCKLKLVAKVNGKKKYYLIKSDGSVLDSFDNTTSESSVSKEFTYDIEKGETYYAYCTGSKMFVYYLSLS